MKPVLQWFRRTASTEHNPDPLGRASCGGLEPALCAVVVGFIGWARAHRMR